MFFVSSFKCSSDFSNIFLITVNPIISVPVYCTTFALYWVIVLLQHKNVLDCSVAPEVYADVILTAYAFNAFKQDLYIWYDYVFLVYIVVIVLLLLLLFFLVFLGSFFLQFLHSSLYQGHAGYLQLVRTLLMCCFSVLSCSGVDETALTQCVKALMTPYLVPYVVMAVPMQVLVSVVGFAGHT